MPVIVESIKNYFETLQKYASKSNFHNLSKKEDIKDIEINGLFGDRFVDEALDFLNVEYSFIKELSADIIKKTVNRHSKSLEFIMVIYQLHGKFTQELDTLKLLRYLWKVGGETSELNYSFASEAFWHLIHDTKSCIPDRSVDLCKRISNRRSSEMSKKNFIITLAKLIFETSTPNFQILFQKIKLLKSDYQPYFDKSTLDSFLTRNMLSHYEHVLRAKAFNMGFTDGNFNFIENGLIMRKVSMKSIEYLKSKNTDLTMHSGSYDTLIFLWKFISDLLTGMEIISEFYTLMGIEKEAKQYQYEFFVFSVKYCVPFRTKSAVRMQMHNDFIYLRLPELSIRNAQLDQLKSNSNNLNNSIQGYQQLPLEHDVAEYHYGINAPEDEYLNNSFNKLSKSKNSLKPHILQLSTDEETEVTFDNCFLFKSTFKVDFLEVFEIVKSYIWKIESPTKTFSVNDEWESHFIEPQNESESLPDEIFSMNLLTPPNSPTKTSSPEIKLKMDNMNAPLRVRRNENRANKPMIIKREKEKWDDSDDSKPIETFETVFLPSKIRNIKYEDPELPRSIFANHKKPSPQDAIDKCTNGFDGATCNRWTVIDRFNELSLQDTLPAKPVVLNDGPSLVKYLEEHTDKFRYLNVPVIHRPIYQRLGLHYLSQDSEKAAFYFSLSVNMGFRQLYVLECLMKVVNTNIQFAVRWKKTHEIISYCLKNEIKMHATMKDLMPMNWTVLQFTMIDEMPISEIKSSLLNPKDGGCFGARNCAVLLVTKYQKIELNGKTKLTVETRILHGFRKTGLQLLDQLEEVKTESASGLKITDRKMWWSKRYSVDTKMKELTDQMRNDWFTDENLKWLMDEDTDLECEPKIIITDRNISKLPMECLLIRDNTKRKCITRMPNLLCLIGHLYQIRYRHVEYPSKLISRTNLEIDPYKAFFVVNPDNSLKETEDAVLPLFKKKMNWEGLAGKTTKSLDSLKILTSKDMLIYCGHGTGCRYFMDRSIKTITSATSMFLIGCQSARFIVEGRSETFGLIMYYLTIGCPSVFGLLWDVTDREIDKFTVKLLSDWLSKKSQVTNDSETYLPAAPLPSYVFNSETVENVQLKTLTGKSAIIFGLPTWIDKNIEVPAWNL